MNEIDTPDLEAIDEALYERQYLPWCQANDLLPTLDGFYLWIEEQY